MADLGLQAWLRDGSENNLVWLQSFGCTIHRAPFGVRVDHPTTPEYRAWLIYGDEGEALDELALLTSNCEEQGVLRVFLRDPIEAPRTVELLRETRFERVGLSQMYASEIALPNLPSMDDRRHLELYRAAVADTTIWAKLYSQGFGRKGEAAERDRARWHHAFESDGPVRSWFIRSGVEDIGVVQTCHAHGLVGIYSFAVLPEARGGDTLQVVLGHILRLLAEEGETRIYFEVERRRGVRARPSIQIGGLNLFVIQTLVEYAEFAGISGRDYPLGHSNSMKTLNMMAHFPLWVPILTSH